MANFIPNEIKRIVPRDPPWITKPLKTMLNRKNKLFKNYKRHGYTPVDKVRLDNFRKECQARGGGYSLLWGDRDVPPGWAGF